jgi:L-amino acid N-acyltransferase YncA
VRQDLCIRRASESDAEAISEIYNWYVLNTILTFETTPVDASEVKRRIKEKLAKHDWIVGELNQQIVGYAYYGSLCAG